ncbi:unnamed protein product [Effrenium voratum]|nr:unnamed protein product [Effrenium voratum]
MGPRRGVSRTSTPESVQRSPSAGSDHPSLAEQGGVWHAGPVHSSVDAEERYALFSPSEIFGGRSADLRRLDAAATDMNFDDAYAASAETQELWHLDRRDVNQPHSSNWPQSAPDYWCSSDAGKICFVPVSAAMKCAPGQYHKRVGEDWNHYRDASAPGNLGGFHCCCVDTEQPGSNWTLVARLADFGLVLNRDAGVRVEFAALVRNDSDSLVASLGAHDECRALFRVDELTLPTGKLLLADPVDIADFAMPSHTAASYEDRGSDDGIDDGPAVPSGLGAGYYPVVLSRDSSRRICRVTLCFHPTRLLKIPKMFPPLPSSKAESKRPPPLPRPSSRQRDGKLLS